MMYLDVITAFEIVLCSLVVLLFLATGFLNMKDLQALREAKWARQDSVALILRMVFYAFLLNFLLIVAINAGILLVSVLRSPTSLQTVLPLTFLSLEGSIGVLLLTGVIYGVAGWKDWYDLIDAE